MTKKNEVWEQLKRVEYFGLPIVTEVELFLLFEPNEDGLLFSALIELQTEEHLTLVKTWLDTAGVCRGEVR